MRETEAAVEQQLCGWAWKTLAVFRRRWNNPARLDWEQLEVAAIHAAGVAYTRFDPARGTALRSYVIAYVRGAILEELRVWDHLTRRERHEAHREEAETGLSPAWAAPPVSLYGAEEELSPLDTIPDPDADTESEALGRIAAGRVRRIVACLPEHERIVTEGRCWEDRSMREIAAGMGVSEARVYQLQQSARQRLREWLAPLQAEREAV